MIPRRGIAIWLLLVLSITIQPQIAPAATSGANPAHQLWQAAAREQAALEQRGIVLHDEVLADYLRKIVSRLWQKMPSDLAPPTFRVVIDSRLEAYAYPNGYCYLTTGMLNQIDNEDQLAMIIAHEMIHYRRQHTVEFYRHFRKTAFVDTGMQYAQASPSVSNGDVAKMIDASESQADREGLALVADAGYCGAEVLELISRLRQTMQSKGLENTARGLSRRAEYVRSLLGRDHLRPCGTSAAQREAREFYLRNIAPALIADAQAALQRGDWNQADRDVSRYLALKPDDALAYYVKGEVLRYRNDGHDLSQCFAYYEKTLKVDPQFPLAHRALGELHFKAGRYRTAKPHFEAFLDLAPHDTSREYIKGYLRQCLD